MQINILDKLKEYESKGLIEILWKQGSFKVTEKGRRQEVLHKIMCLSPQTALQLSNQIWKEGKDVRSK